MTRVCRYPLLKWSGAAASLFAVLFLLPGKSAADWIQIPLPSQVHYLPGLAAGSEYLYASMSDTSWTRLGLFRTPLENPGIWESLGLEGYSLRSIIVAGDGDSHILVPGSGDTQLLGSTDGGQTWAPRDAGFEDDGRWVRSLGWNGVFPGRVYASARRPSGGFWIYHSTDFGVSWTAWTGGCESCIASFHHFAIPQDGGLLAYVMETTGYWTDYRYKTTDGGIDWLRLLPDLWETFIDLEISTDRRDLFGSLYGGILWWRDDDYYGDGILPPFKFCGTIGAETAVWAPGILFVAGADADTLLTVVSTEYPYTDWTIMQEGLPGSKVDPCEAYDPYDGGPMFQFEAAPHAPYLFVSAPGNGLWMRDMSDVVAVAEQGGLVQSGLELLPSLPNPASGGVAFRAPGAQGQPITVEVIDVSGRSIRRWTTTPVGPEGLFTWDGRALDGRMVPPGIYCLKAESSRGTAATTFTILR